MNKRIYLVVTLVTLIATTFASCSDDIVDEKGKGIGKKVTLNFLGNANSDPKTRVVIEGDASTSAGSVIDFLWTEGDVIYVNGTASEPLAKAAMVNPQEKTDNYGKKYFASKLATFTATVDAAATYKIDFRGKQKYNATLVDLPFTDVNPLSASLEADYAIGVATEKDGGYTFTLERQCCYVAVDITCEGGWKPEIDYMTTITLAFTETQLAGNSSSQMKIYSSGASLLPIDGDGKFTVLSNGSAYSGTHIAYDYDFQEVAKPLRMIPVDGKIFRFCYAFRPPMVGDKSRGSTLLDPNRVKYVRLELGGFFDNLLTTYSLCKISRPTEKAQNKYNQEQFVPIDVSKSLQKGKVIYFKRYLSRGITQRS